MVLYQKVGRRYLPVHDTQAIDGLHNGSWLVTVQDGLTKVRRPLDDGHGLALVAACQRWLSEWLVKALIESGVYRFGQSSRPLTAKERRAVKAYRDVAGANCMIWMTKASAHDIAEKVVLELTERVKNGQCSCLC